MRFMNTSKAAVQAFTDGFTMERWRKYAGGVSPGLADKAEKDAAEYDFYRDVLPVIMAALDEDEISRVSAFYVKMKRTCCNIGTV